ncbi:MAG TPA: PA14 domain-containing protein, partial [Verrucomicrobiae bacterium]|nr:PA14 domain-containing protein [Verrucomicrobiae bacterium]
MNIDSSLVARNSFRAGLLALALALLPVVARAADSFVEPLSGFEPVDAAVDPQDGTTFVLGRDVSGVATLRRYDNTGGEVLWGLLPTDGTNRFIERKLTGVTPAAMFVGAGTSNLFVVGGSKITRVNKATGGSVATATGPSQLGLRDVYVQGNQVYLCGTLSSGASVFGLAATARGSQAAIAFRLDASLTGNALALATFGSGGINSAESIVVDEAGGIYVAGGLGTGGTFGSDFGLMGRWQVRTARSSEHLTSLAGAVDVLNGINRVASASGTADVIDFRDSNFPGGNQDNFAFQATGLIALAPGRYIFYNRTDDGSYLKIDGTTVIYDNTQHGEEDHSGERFIGPGLHSVEFVMFDQGGDAVAKLEYQLKDGGTRDFLRTVGTSGGNKGYVFKLNPDLNGVLGVYFSTENSQSLGGAIRELHYAQGWVYAAGFWKGKANNALIGFPDDSSGDSEDVEIIKLDTDLVAKGRATIKGLANNHAFSVNSDEGGNVYVAGNFGTGSVDFFGARDRSSTGASNDTPSMSLSSAKVNLFVAKLDQDMNYQWVRAPRLPADGYSSTSVPRVRWNQSLQRLFWVGYISSGSLVMGEPESEKQLDSPKGFVAVFDPDGRFTERVNLTIISEFGQSEVQVLPFGGPRLNGGNTTTNTRPRIKGAEISASVPRFMYKDGVNADLTLSEDELANAQLINDRAETRIVSAGYSVDDNVPIGDASSYRFIIQQDTTVTFNWTVEYALTIKSDFTETVGDVIAGISSDASGNPAPVVKKHWIPRNDPVIASIDAELPDLNNPLLPVKYLVTGYRASGAATNAAVTATFPFYPYPGNEVRRQVPQFVMSGPAKITNMWKLKIGVQVTTTGNKSGNLPLVRVVKDSPSASGPPTQADGVGSGTFFYNEHTVLEIGTVKNEDTQQLKGWMNGDGTVFPPTGELADLPTMMIGGKQYSARSVPSLVRPARVLWDYGDRIFEETVNIGNPVTFRTVDDAGIFGRILTNEAPSRVEVTQGPQGSLGDAMTIWDDVGKKLYPLRPGVVMSFWKTSTDPEEFIIVRVIIRYPDSPHYNHIAGTPPVRLDPGTNDLVRFREMKFTEPATGAAASLAEGFTATGPGRTVLLFTETSSSGHSGPLETLRVRVVNTRLWNDALPAPVTAR